MSDLLVSSTADACYTTTSILIDSSEAAANRLQQQYDWLDAMTSYRLSNTPSRLGSSNQDNRLRTRRHERLSTSWQLRTHIQQYHAILHRFANSVAHQLNKSVALSKILPLSLPKEYISFPFHSFW